MRINIKLKGSSKGISLEAGTRFFLTLLINSCFPALLYDPALILKATNNLTIPGTVITEDGDEISFTKS